jgi:uncharacterized protein YjbJ (UPF0337 family)
MLFDSSSDLRRHDMNWDQIQGKWKQSGINGKREQLVGKIQERYGIAKDAAEKQVDEFTSSYRLDDASKSAKSSFRSR